MSIPKVSFEENIELSFAIRAMVTLLILAVIITAIVVPIKADRGRHLLVTLTFPMVVMGLLMGGLLSLFCVQEVDISEGSLNVRYGLYRQFPLAAMQNVRPGSFHFGNTGGWGLRGLKNMYFVPRYGPAIFFEFHNGRRMKTYAFATDQPQKLYALIKAGQALEQASRDSAIPLERAESRLT